MVRFTENLTDLFEIQRNVLLSDSHTEGLKVEREKFSHAIDRLWLRAKQQEHNHLLKQSRNNDFAMLIVVPEGYMSVIDQMKRVSFEDRFGCVDARFEQEIALLANVTSLQTSPEPYLVLQVSSGLENIGIPAYRTVQQFQKEKRQPLTVYEGMAMVRNYPEAVHNHNLVFPGSRVGTRYTPDIWRRKNELVLSYRPFSSGDIRWGCASCATRIFAHS